MSDTENEFKPIPMTFPRRYSEKFLEARKQRHNKVGYALPPHGFKRRTVNLYQLKGVRWLSPFDMISILQGHTNPYEYKPVDPEKPDLARLTYVQELWIRDKALAAFITLSCCRIGEALKPKKSQVDLTSNKDFVLIKQFQVSKRKKGKLQFIRELPMTKERDALLYPLTKMFLDHCRNVHDEDSPLFQIGKRRAEQIICGLDPVLFPHFIRAFSLTFYMSITRDPAYVARTFGVEKLETLMRYYNEAWTLYQKELGLTQKDFSQRKTPMDRVEFA